MPRQFGRRTARPTDQSANTPARPSTRLPPDAANLKKLGMMLGLTVALVAGAAGIAPRLIRACEGHQPGALGIDWCQSMGVAIRGAVTGMAAGAGRR